jgi:hypothetical protein
MRSSVSVNLWLAAGWLIFLFSFLMPAYGPSKADLTPALSSSSPITSQADNAIFSGFNATPKLTGWDAMHAAFDASGYPVASASTNLLIVLAALAMWSPRFASWFCWVVAAAAVFNLWWIMSSKEDSGSYRIGYYTWLVSYVLVAIGLFKLANSARGPGPNNAEFQTPV